MSLASIEQVMTRLCREPRTAGTERNRSVAGMIQDLMVKMDYDTTVHEYPFRGWKLLAEPTARFLSPRKQTISVLPVVWSGSTFGKLKTGIVSPTFEAMKTFEAYYFQRYPVLDADGKSIAVLLSRPDTVWMQPLDGPGEVLPYLLVDPASCALINDWISKKKKIQIEFSVDAKEVANRKIRNVVASCGQRPAIVLSTHYDSFFNTVGAHDNASGVACLLEIADLLEKPIRARCQVCFFDAEEWNKYGSYQYVNELKEAKKLKRLRLVINIDSVGVPGDIYIYSSSDIAPVVKKAIDAVGPDDIGVFFRSVNELPQFDVWPFQREGCSVIQIGSRPRVPFKYWHSPDDVLERIDFSFIGRVSRYVSRLISEVSKPSVRARLMRK